MTKSATETRHLKIQTYKMCVQFVDSKTQKNFIHIHLMWLAKVSQCVRFSMTSINTWFDLCAKTKNMDSNLSTEMHIELNDKNAVALKPVVVPNEKHVNFTK